MSTIFRFAGRLVLAAMLYSALISQVCGQAPLITQHPASQTIFYGDAVTFKVTATGSPTLRYQWLRNGAAIPSATTTGYTVASVASGDNNAAFSVRVTNSLGAVTSSIAMLTVDPGLPGTAVTNRVLNFTNIWKYNQTNNLDGVNWTATNYNDATWPAGGGLFGYENNSSIAPLIKTTLASPQAPPAGLSPAHAYYFRTAVVTTNDLLPGTMLATIRADDGAMIYINGAEAKRIRMPSGTITNLSFTTGFPPDSSGGTDATVDEIFEMPGWGLQLGSNVIAASVHQANSGSGDVVWGMALDTVGYQRMRDTNAPVLSELLPTPGSTVALFGQLEVHFNKGVKGVEAGDLLINGSPATNVTAYGPNLYVFDFLPQAPGPVQVSWIASHGIVDLTANSNRFSGGNYTYTVDPNAIATQVLISEFMAGNTGTIRDEDGTYSDWVEIYNAGLDSVSLTGWYLTDTPATLAKWRFPAGVTLPSRAYLLVWASGKDRTNAAAPLHTSFKLNKAAGSYIALVYSDATTVVSSFSAYPQQYDDVSYGRDRLDPSVTGYFTNATPGAANATLGAGFGPEVSFSATSRTFQQSFALTLSTKDPGSVIRYFLVTNSTAAAQTNMPNATSPVYTGPLTISSSTQVRARAFPTQPGYFPGPPHSETYLQLDASVAQVSSDVPIVVFHNMGAGDIAATADQFMTMQVFDTIYGRSSPTNPPDQSAQGIFHRRGQATFWNPKPNLRVETRDEFGDDIDVPLAGFPADSDWVFYGVNQYDKVLMHNRLSHQLYRDLGHYSSRTRFVEVYLKLGSGTAGPITSADYYGLYVLEEKVKIGNKRVDIDKLRPENTNAPAVTGGYLLSIDKTKAGDPPQFTAANLSITYVDPDYYDIINRPTQRQYISDYLNSFYSALNSPSWTNPITGYAAYIDLNSWIDYHLHQTLVFNVDALRISSYFHKPRNGKIVQGPLWDFDRCFGTRTGDDARAFNPRRWRSADMDGGTDMFNSANTFSNPWYSRLFTDPDFWQRWIDRYQDLRRSSYSNTNLSARIDQLGNEVREATSREYVRWAGGGSSDTTPRSGSVTGDGLTYTFPTPGTWQGELDFVKWWFSNRVDFMDSNFLNPPVFSRGGGPIPSGLSLTITASTVEPNSTIYYTLDGTDPRLPGGAVSPSAFAGLNSASITLTSNARVFARNFNSAHQNLTGANNPPLNSYWSGPTVATYYTGIPPLRITELMYNPVAPPAGNTNDADNFEFIGLKNISASSLNLRGFRLGGGVDFTFPDLTLAAAQEVVVVKDLAAFQSRYGTGVLVAGVYTNKLSNDGDHVVLEGPMSEPILDFTYEDIWYPATDGLGFSLVIVDPDAAPGTWSLKESWRPSGSINGSPGQNEPTPSLINAVLINEALAHTDPPLEDSIELYNPGPGQANVGGWLLTDDRHNPAKYRIPDGTVIPAGAYITITSNQFSVGPRAFSLSSTGEEVYLFSADGATNLTGYAHGYSFGPSPNGIAFCRYVNSQGDEHFVLESRNTLGASNAYPRVGPVVVTELMYNPPSSSAAVDNFLDEFIELQNIAVTNVTLFDPSAATNTWRLRHAVDFDFPMNVTLAPGARALVVGFDPAKYPGQLSSFKSKYNVPGNVAVFGPWNGKLNNAGERVELYCPDNPNVTPTNSYTPYYLVEAVDYKPSAPWPTNADGGGASLQRLQPGLYANDPLNWGGAAPTAGQAPSTPTIDTQPVDQTVALGGNATFRVSASGAAPLNYQWRFNGVNIAGATLSTYTVLNAQFTHEGNYSVVVANAAGTVTSSAARLTVLYPPVITQQPAGQAVASGSPLTLAVQAVGSAPLSYQWRVNGADIVGQTQADLVFASVQATDAGAYNVVVTNDVGSVTSSVAMITVLVAPSITGQPASQSVTAGQSVTFFVTAAGSGPLSYQWQYNGMEIGGATSSSYRINIVEPANEGNYSVMVRNQVGSALSTAAYLSVLVPPSITTQPANQTVTAGSAVTFVVSAIGSAPLSYQWLFKGAAISGATRSSYLISNAQSVDEGVYAVVVTNQVGSTTSAAAFLTVLVPPSITAQPTNLTVITGSNATFTVMATGSSPLSYQWQFKGVDITGATFSSHTIANAQPAHEGTYSVTVTNKAGIANSAAASLTVLVPPSITVQPTNLTVIAGTSATFSVTASGSVPLSYQWRFEGSDIAGATLSNYTVTEAQLANDGSYSVIVTNGAGAVSSVSATLIVLVPPIITAQPTNLTITAGSNATFTVGATGSAPLTYQWRFEGADISGATLSTYTISGVGPVNEGRYSVLVTNQAGFVDSTAVLLTVLLPPQISSQPASQTVVVGSNAVFTVAATGSMPLFYQWHFDGTPVPGATLSSYTLVGVEPGNAGAYTVLVSNLAASVTSIVANLTVLGPPVITGQPLDLTVALGTNANFSVRATGSPPLYYQWYFDRTNLLSGETNAEIFIANAGLNNTGDYHVVVTNAAGSVTSQTATLTVVLPPSITIQPVTQKAAAGSQVMFSVRASGAGPLSYQWQLNGKSIIGATLADYAITNVQPIHAGVYKVGVTNGVGGIESAPVVLTVVTEPPVIGSFSRTGSVSSASLETWQGLSYMLEYRNDMRAGMWTPLLPSVPGTGRTILLSDTNSPADTSRFYRVRVE